MNVHLYKVYGHSWAYTCMHTHKHMMSYKSFAMCIPSHAYSNDGIQLYIHRVMHLICRCIKNCYQATTQPSIQQAMSNKNNILYTPYMHVIKIYKHFISEQ